MKNISQKLSEASKVWVALGYKSNFFCKPFHDQRRFIEAAEILVKNEPASNDS